MNAMQAQPHITEDTLFFWTGTDNLRRGPVALAALRNLVRNGTVPKSAQLWCDGWPDWQPLARLAQQLALPMHTQAAVPADILPVTTPRPWRKIAAWCVAWLALFGTVIFLVAAKLGYGDWLAATSRLEEIAEANFPSPDTLKICGFLSATKERIDKDTIVLTGWLEHRNHFNAVVRKRWKVMVRDGSAIMADVSD